MKITLENEFGVYSTEVESNSKSSLSELEEVFMGLVGVLLSATYAYSTILEGMEEFVNEYKEG